MTRIAGTEQSVISILANMSNGNPGALNVCGQIFRHTANIDMASALGGLGPILTLDSLGVYGSEIWMLYKDVCKEKLVNMIALLRAYQLGFVEGDALKHAIQNYGEGVDVDAACAKVKAELGDMFCWEYETRV